jgi:hypothetical protein
MLQGESHYQGRRPWLYNLSPFRRTSRGMPTAVRNAVIVSRNAISFTAADGKARVPAVSGTDRLPVQQKLT